MKKEIKSLVHYDLPNSREERVCHLPAYTKSNYIFHCFRRLGLENYIISASVTKGKKRVKGSVIRLDETTSLERLYCLGHRTRVGSVITRKIFMLYRDIRLRALIQDGDTLWAYHSLNTTRALRKLKRRRNFRLILEVEEIYGDVRQSKELSEREVEFAQLADAYIFPTQELNQKVNLQGKPYAIAHGTYHTAEPPTEPVPEDGIIHVVYSGTMDPRKGGVNVAIDAAQYLPKQYHVHILGTGTPENLAAAQARIEAVRPLCACTVTYDGVLRDKAYTDFLHRCHIGLSTQNPDAAFNATSFPSKILSYMASGLRVVSVRIPVVENSNVGQAMYYYDEQTPTSIAKAIMAVDLSDGYNSKALIDRLDQAFLADLQALLETAPHPTQASSKLS